MRIWPALEADAPPGWKILALLNPAAAQVESPIAGAVAVLVNQSERGYDDRPLQEPGFAFRVAPAPPDCPPVLLFDDREGTFIEPQGHVSGEYDEDYDDREGDELYDETLLPSELVTKLGGVPYIIQGEHELQANCSHCDERLEFMAQLVGEEAIDLGDGALYIFVCPKGCEIRAKYQR